MGALEGNSLVLVASHNAETVDLALDTMKKLELTSENVRFGQLKGFSD